MQQNGKEVKIDFQGLTGNRSGKRPNAELYANHVCREQAVDRINDVPFAAEINGENEMK